MTLTTIARYVLVAVIAAALAIQVGVVEASTQETGEGCYLEDGSYAENCDSYFAPAPPTSDDGWLVMIWTPGQTDTCVIFVPDETRDYADSLAADAQSAGYAATAVHYTDSLYNKLPDC